MNSWDFSHHWVYVITIILVFFIYYNHQLLLELPSYYKYIYSNEFDLILYICKPNPLIGAMRHNKIHKF